MALPHEMGLWRMAAAELAVPFRWTQRQPAALDRFLAGWEQACIDDGDRQSVVDWRRGLAFQNVTGLETLPYWLDQLAATRAGTPMAAYVEDTIRELLATHAVTVLPDLLLPGLLVPDAMALMRVYHGRVPVWSPIDARDGTPRLRSDPFGYAFERQGAAVVSPGLEMRKFQVRTQAVRAQLEQESLTRGRPPADRDEAITWGFRLPDPPCGGAWDLSQTSPRVVWPQPAAQPWVLR
jgi:hypothetical protein